MMKNEAEIVQVINLNEHCLVKFVNLDEINCIKHVFYKFDAAWIPTKQH